MTGGLNFHPLANIFPLLEGERFDALVDSIGKNGLIDPVTLYEGQIIDGRNRFRACQAAGVEPRFVDLEWTGLVSDFVWARGERREQTAGERVISAGRYAVAREGEARARQGTRTDLTSVQICTEVDSDLFGEAGAPKPDVDFGRSREIASEKFGLSERTVSNSIKVVKEGAPELVATVERGDVSVSAAAEVASLPRTKQVEIVARGEKEILQAAKTIRAEKAEVRARENAEVRAKEITIPDGRYGVIVMDPPWPMQKIERDVRPNQVSFDYPTMDETELRAFGSVVEKLAADDCHLFMWTTQKFMPLALSLVEHYGFRYVLQMVWHKPGGFQPIGLPQYNCEFVVYARRGSPTFVDTKAFPCCFEAPRREHSRKPDEFYETIRRVTDGARIDVFSREPRDGFSQFGNEAEKFAGAA